MTSTGAAGSSSPAPLPLSPTASHPASPFQSDAAVCHAPEWRIDTASNSPTVTPRTSYNGITGANLLGASPGHPLLYQAQPLAATAANRAGTAVSGKPPPAAIGSARNPSCFGPTRDSRSCNTQPPRLSLPGHVVLLDTATPQLPWPTSYSSLASTASVAAASASSVRTSFCSNSSGCSSSRSSRCSSESEEREAESHVVRSCGVTPCSVPNVHTSLARGSPFTTEFNFVPAAARRPQPLPGIHQQPQQRQQRMQQQQQQQQGGRNPQTSMPLPYRASWSGPQQGPPSHTLRHMGPAFGAGWDSAVAQGRAPAGLVGTGRAVPPHVPLAGHQRMGVGAVVPLDVGCTAAPLQRCSSAVDSPDGCGGRGLGQRMLCHQQPGVHGGQQEQQLLLPRAGMGQGRGLLPLVLPPPVRAAALGTGLRGMRSAAL